MRINLYLGDIISVHFVGNYRYLAGNIGLKIWVRRKWKKNDSLGIRYIDMKNGERY